MGHIKCMTYIILIGLLIPFVECQSNTVAVKIILLKQVDDQLEFVEWYHEVISSFKTSVKYDTIVVDVNDEEEDAAKICNEIESGGSIILDISWYENDAAKGISADTGIPYLRIDVSIGPILDFLDSFLDLRNSSDVSVIFEKPSLLDQSLYHWIDTTRLRLYMAESLDIFTARKLKDLRPIPNNFAILASTKNMTKMFKMALQEDLVKLPERWNLVFLDFLHYNFDRLLLQKMPINLLLPSINVCCQLLMLENFCQCPENFNIQKEFLRLGIQTIVDIVEDILQKGMELTDSLQCNGTTKYDEQSQRKFEELLNSSLSKEENIGMLAKDGYTLKLKMAGIIETGANLSASAVARYEEDKVKVIGNKTIKPIRAYYRIGVTHALPWAYKIRDPKAGTWNWTGYCVDFAARIAEKLNFDYDLVEPKSGTFGKKINGVWDGLIGDLASGETDMAVAPLVMTADREEVVDFIAPYFEQGGITIVMRKPVRKTSLFKFMTVLKLEVWLSIVAAIIATGFMVWFLDKYSPYSARNNKRAYPYPCREFTFKESYWFALTSFTPQGGGEAPKALSGRALVAAYWLFVVLMLATFTANLAAFLTVERMQAPVQSLDQLARQSRINYTVVKDSLTHRYFINMKFAEDTLYRMWKELTLNASTDDTRYQVWDYPIKEQYGRILLAINDSNPVATAEEGFRNVDEHLDADYAFIHDSSEIRYEISRNCNFTEVGEVFAEKPYAIAVQQGSHLQDDISKTLLQLHKDRFHEALMEKYWNSSAKGDCQNADDNEGITLESLGGVFIATLFGLALAMITLAGEVLYYRRKRSKTKVSKHEASDKSFAANAQLTRIPDKMLQSQNYPITFGTTFKPVNLKDKLQKEREEMKISHINLYPRARHTITQVKHS